MELREVDCLEDFFTTQAMVDPDQIYHYMVTLGKTYLSRGQKDYDVDPYCQIVLCKITTVNVYTWCLPCGPSLYQTSYRLTNLIFIMKL